jgi:hypothetical protein
MLSFAIFHASPMYYANKIEIHLLKIIGIHLHKMLHKIIIINVALKKWMLPLAPWYKNVQI